MNLFGGRDGPVIAISNLDTRLRVGIWDHERDFQPVHVNLVMAPEAARLRPGGGGIDYRSILRWITEEWPQAPHTPLLETRLRELIDFVFACDLGVVWLDAALSKPQACPEARGVGVRMALSRSEHAELFATTKGDRCSESPRRSVPSTWLRC
jgi:dihydroneopterin aldolase